MFPNENKGLWARVVGINGKQSFTVEYNSKDLEIELTDKITDRLNSLYGSPNFELTTEYSVLIEMKENNRLNIEGLSTVTMLIGNR